MGWLPGWHRFRIKRMARGTCVYVDLQLQLQWTEHGLVPRMMGVPQRAVVVLQKHSRSCNSPKSDSNLKDEAATLTARAGAMMTNQPDELATT